MASFRDIKRKARSDVHRVLRVRALYLTTRDDENPLPCFVRVHTKFAALGDIGDTNDSYAEREEITPRIIIWRDEIPQPMRDAIISVEAGEAYYLEVVQPPDGQTITATVTQMPVAETVGLPVPEVDNG